MPFSQLLKFSKIYQDYGLGAAKNFYLLVSLISLGQTVNLYKLKDHVSSVLGKTHTDVQSHYQRLIRFFKDWGKSEEFLHDILRHNLGLLRQGGHQTLILDGTSWQFGQTEIHYLVLAVQVGGVAIPLYWKQLGKIGTSNQEERKEMMDEALGIFDLRGMTLLADREYIGKEWFKYLSDKGLHFVIRMKRGDYEQDTNAVCGRSYRAMYRRCQQKKKVVSKRITLNHTSYTLVMMPNPKVGADEPVMVFLTTLRSSRYAAAAYKLRWKIECMFKHLKTNGYHLEDLNLKDAGKTRLMMALVATAYLLALREGWRRKKKIPLKKYADGTRWPACSLFRAGLAYLIEKSQQLQRFLTYLESISKTPKTPPD
ncbi:MAG: transposase [Bacteroidia bacterium]